MTCRAWRASASENARTSPSPAGVRRFSDGNRSGAPITTVHASATAHQYTIRLRIEPGAKQPIRLTDARLNAKVQPPLGGTRGSYGLASAKAAKKNLTFFASFAASAFDRDVRVAR